MGDINKWCPMCGAAPGDPCTVISGDPNAGIALWHDDNARKPGLRPGDPRPEPHFYRHNDHPIPVAVKDEPAGVGEARPAEPFDEKPEGYDKLVFGSPADEEQPDARARRIAEHLGYCPHSTAEDEAAGAAVLKLVAECARLREQLDAARQALTDLSEAVDAVCQSDVAGDAPTLEAPARSVLELSLQRARAALGDVAADKLPSVDDHPGYDGDK